MSRANNKANDSHSGRRQPVTSRGEDKRRLILEAAAELLATDGYAGTSLSDIASAAGTFAGSLYYHFESREALAVEVLTGGIEAALEHNRTAIEALADDVSHKERMGVALAAHVSFMLEQNQATLAGFRVVGQLPPAVAGPVRAAHRTYLDHFASLFEAAVTDGVFDGAVNLAAARMLVVGAAGSTVDWFDPEGGLLPEEIAQLLLRMVFDGIGSEQSSS